ncbi:diacylglycerol/polyprenol kinase family protein [Dyadobacter luticola]|uniref:Phosphatidate cytidylyltransferase n=1 Tax=Dyadobacter luticola TaxID=1979387 RepID=A0A5R9L3C8_9BACT|nr:phosphatidate cytidylyltransferase [Dyadobacter luticola]TLV02918.1 phosphatidate cytidylyltransferase [Dyadobacter luticola]
MFAEILPMLILAACFLALFGVAELLYHQFNVKPELTRKLVHLGTGLLTMLFPIFLTSHWQVLILCSSFLIILLLSLKFKLLPSINAIDRDSHGSILFPVAVYACFLMYTLLDKGVVIFYLPILILAICDPIAALTGKKFPFGTYQIGQCKKTISGSAAFFVCNLIVSAIVFYILKIQLESAVWNLIILSIVATIAEAISWKGSDNLSIPASVAITLSLIL